MSAFNQINLFDDHFIDYYHSIHKEQKDIIVKHTKNYPVNLNGILRDFGISLIEKELNSDISGKIYIENNKFSIMVNDYHSNNRKRFTIAHELGHYLLHYDEILKAAIVDNSLYRSDRLSTRIDVEANRFAAKLLMPMDLIEKIKQEKNNLNYISSELQVSREALCIRLGIPYND